MGIGEGAGADRADHRPVTADQGREGGFIAMDAETLQERGVAELLVHAAPQPAFELSGQDLRGHGRSFPFASPPLVPAERPAHTLFWGRRWFSLPWPPSRRGPMTDFFLSFWEGFVETLAMIAGPVGRFARPYVTFA